MAGDVELEIGNRSVRISNPDRVYFPARGETKLDLVRYYLSVGDGIVRALRERPCMMHRFPSGVAGEKVHQKWVPQGAGVSGAPGSSPGAPSPAGNGRRARPSSAERHALVAIRYNQVRTDARVWSYRSRAFHARSIVSCTRSSASWNEPSIR